MTQDIAPPAPKASTFARGKRGNFENRLEEVLRVAARLFSEQGFRQATLEDVAAALNVTRPALYHYSRSKDELAAKCLDIAIAEISEAAESARRHKTGREQIAAFFRRYAEIICDDFGRCFVLVNRREYGPELQEINRTHQRRIDHVVRDMARAGVADGSLREVDPADVSRALFGAINGIPVWYRPGGRRTPGRIADDFLFLMLTGMAP
ncbi:MAG TPA: TetR/AcrR family transcriptional regulator [Caulobacteraceae bacterium]|jgi:AcrR family transcriptional regulator